MLRSILTPKPTHKLRVRRPPSFRHETEGVMEIRILQVVEPLLKVHVFPFFSSSGPASVESVILGDCLAHACGR